MTPLAPEKAPVAAPSMARSALIVNQPKRLEGILLAIADLEKISEVQGDAHSGDWSGASGGATGGGQKKAGPTPRDQAIANLPAPVVMQGQLKQHIEKEVKQLRKVAKRIAGGQPGAAYRLNQIYAKIRRLNTLLSELLDAASDVVKRLFIRVFVDRQAIL